LLWLGAFGLILGPIRNLVIVNLLWGA
jgi:hypothetical protein